MIRTDLVISSPIFLLGLLETLDNADVKVVAVRTSPEKEPSWLADIVLLDIDAMAPDERITEIARAACSTAVLVLSHDAEDDHTDYLRAGAAGVISKRESAERLVDAIRSVTAGSRLGHPKPSPLPAVERTEAPVQQLSEREEQVLRQIARGLTHGQIATRLGISPHTVDTYVKRIRAKLGVGNKAELTRAALLGRMLRDQPSDPSGPDGGTHHRVVPAA